MKITYGPLDFASDAGVPRETLSRFSTYANLLNEWNQRLNLVAPSTLPLVWHRHFWDSAQLAPLIPTHARTIVDLGSGAGFPGMVLAIMLNPLPRSGDGSGVGIQGPTVHLIESTRKKCRFLEEVAALTATRVQIHWSRAEAVKGLKADVVTARALAPLDRLLAWAHPLFGPGATGLFLKGRSLDRELTQAVKSWRLDATQIPSRSDLSGMILRVTGLSPWPMPRKRR